MIPGSAPIQAAFQLNAAIAKAAASTLAPGAGDDGSERRPRRSDPERTLAVVEIQRWGTANLTLLTDGDPDDVADEIERWSKYGGDLDLDGTVIAGDNAVDPREER